MYTPQMNLNPGGVIPVAFSGYHPQVPNPVVPTSIQIANPTQVGLTCSNVSGSGQAPRMPGSLEGTGNYIQTGLATVGPTHMVSSLPSPSLVTASSMAGLTHTGTGIQTYGNLATTTAAVDFHVPLKVKQQIWADDYFDLALLLNKNAASPPEASFSLDLEGPTPTFKSAIPKASVKITSILQWIEAFEIFMAIYTQRLPLSCAALVKHSQNVRELYSLGGDWQYYDQQFRLMRRSTPIPWEQGCPTLWSKALARKTIPKYQSGFNKAQQRKTFSPTRATKFNVPKGFCFTFSNGKKCIKAKNCSFQHKCFKCKQPHPAVYCNKSTTQGSPPTVPAIANTNQTR